MLEKRLRDIQLPKLEQSQHCSYALVELCALTDNATALNVMFYGLEQRAACPVILVIGRFFEY